MCIEDLRFIVAELYKKYHRIMVYRAIHYVSNIADAEDIVSNCWLTLLRHIDQLSKMTEQGQCAYIMRSVRNAATDFVRKRQKEKQSLLVGIHYESYLDAELMKNQQEILTGEEEEYYDIFLSLLPPQERKALQLKMEGWKTVRIAETMKISETSVRVYVNRALGRIRSYISSTENGKPNG